MILRPTHDQLQVGLKVHYFSPSDGKYYFAKILEINEIHIEVERAYLDYDMHRHLLYHTIPITDIDYLIT